MAVAALPEEIAKADPVRIADDRLQVGLDPATGSLRELIGIEDGFDRLADGGEPVALWQITVKEGSASKVVTAGQAGPPRLEPMPHDAAGWRLVWEHVDAVGEKPLRVEVRVQLGFQDAPLSRWELSVAKPKTVRLTEVRFPRVSGLREQAEEMLAAPNELGAVARDPRRLLEGREQKGGRLAWGYPYPLSIPCLAWYQENGPGFYAAADDPQCYRKELAFWRDAANRVHFEVVHEPEQQADQVEEFRLPFAVVLGAMRGDWTTAAELYRDSPAARAIAGRGRLRRELTPAWLPATSLWVWNRGRSPGVLEPAMAMQQHLQAPVAVLWHWWHGCGYDAGFPDYLPPREGAAACKAALEAARAQNVHSLLYMNQRLWCTETRSWTDEDAEAHAVKGSDGKIQTEVHNVFTKSACAAMCIATRFWRDTYAALAQAVVCDLKADGVYMDQTGCLSDCHDPNHGHIAGSGRYWTDGLATLTADIRDRCSGEGRIALGGEYCGEPWIGSLDATLALSVSAERGFLDANWEPIPFFQAVYHGGTIVFGNYAGLVHPPYDEKWPAEKKGAEALRLLDRKFSQQFLLDQARTFVWGMQPMISNFLPAQIEERPEEIDFVTRLARTRMQALEYLLHGTWLRPPALDVPLREIAVAQVGVYQPLRSAKRTFPVALAGAWRARDGGVAIALASIHDEGFVVRVPIDATGWGLHDGCAVYRIDDRGRHRLGVLDTRQTAWEVALPRRGLCLLEFCANAGE